MNGSERLNESKWNPVVTKVLFMNARLVFDLSRYRRSWPLTIKYITDNMRINLKIVSIIIPLGAWYNVTQIYRSCLTRDIDVLKRCNIKQLPWLQ